MEEHDNRGVKVPLKELWQRCGERLKQLEKDFAAELLALTCPIDSMPVLHSTYVVCRMFARITIDRADRACRGIIQQLLFRKPFQSSKPGLQCTADVSG